MPWQLNWSAHEPSSRSCRCEAAGPFVAQSDRAFTGAATRFARLPRMRTALVAAACFAVCAQALAAGTPRIQFDQKVCDFETARRECLLVVQIQNTGDGISSGR